MSTIKVNKIENTSTTNGGVSIDNDGHVTIDGQQLPTAGPLSNRNLIINGAMAISQRGTGWEDVVDIGPGDYLLDRFKTFHFPGTGGTSVLEQQQSSDVPTGQGFKTSLALRVKTAGALPNNGYMLLCQAIEGYNINSLEFGTANAKNVTISFWAKSSVTGTYSVVIRNHDSTRTYVKDYDLVSGTWKHVTLTVPGETSGTWNITNSTGLQVTWAIDTGSLWNTAPDTWNTSNLFGSTNQTNTWADTASNTFHLTGVQVEVGSKATPFEHRSYGDELQRCQRYCYRVDGNANGYLCSLAGYDGNQAIGTLVFPVTMRNPPSQLMTTGTAADYGVVMGSTVSNSTSIPVMNTASNNSSGINFFATGDCPNGKAGHGRLINSAAYLVFTELLNYEKL